MSTNFLRVILSNVKFKDCSLTTREKQLSCNSLFISESVKENQVKEEIVNPSSTAVLNTNDSYVILTFVLLAMVCRWTWERIFVILDNVFVGSCTQCLVTKAVKILREKLRLNKPRNLCTILVCSSHKYGKWSSLNVSNKTINMLAHKWANRKENIEKDEKYEYA